MMPSTSLSRHRAVDEGEGRRRGLATAGEERPQVVEGERERRRAGRVVRAVEQDLAPVDLEELQPAGPRGRAVAAPPGRRDRPWRCRPRPARPGRRRPRPRSLPGAGREARFASGPGRRARTSMPSRSQPSSGAEATSVSGAPTRRARRRMTSSASPRRAGDREVAALDDRRLLARDRGDRVAEPGHVVEGDVRDRRHAAVPGMGRVEPAAEPDLDQRDLHALLGEPAEEHRGEELELGRLAVAPRDAVGDARGPRRRAG